MSRAPTVFHSVEKRFIPRGRDFPRRGKPGPIFPRNGKTFADFSTQWKTFAGFFHAMENLCGIFPRCGKKIHPAWAGFSTVWKTAARCALNPAAPTPGPAH